MGPEKAKKQRKATETKRTKKNMGGKLKEVRLQKSGRGLKQASEPEVRKGRKLSYRDKEKTGRSLRGELEKSGQEAGAADEGRTEARRWRRSNRRLRGGTKRWR